MLIYMFSCIFKITIINILYHIVVYSIVWKHANDLIFD